MPITDRTIRSMRNDEADRYIAHYMQPHLPPIYQNSSLGGLRPDDGWTKGNPWKRVKQGELNADEAILGYENNLEPVLDSIDVLLSNVCAEKVVITADHGNYLGENKKWGHPKRDLGEPVRLVPWWETRAKNTGSYQPKSHNTKRKSISRKEQLESLGYL